MAFTLAIFQNSAEMSFQHMNGGRGGLTAGIFESLRARILPYTHR